MDITKRIWAGGIDFFVLMVFHVIMTLMIITYVSEETLIDHLQVWKMIGLSLISILCFSAYATLDEYLCGQTVGKRILNIKVISEHGDKLSLTQSFIRNIFRILELYNPLFIGLILICKKGQRLGDIYGKTKVVHVNHKRENILFRKSEHELHRFVIFCMKIMVIFNVAIALLVVMLSAISFLNGNLLGGTSPSVSAGLIYFLVSPLIGIVCGLIFGIVYYYPYVLAKRIYYKFIK
jgi:uncharacterized RDD family membrane protein YckC